MHSVQSPWPCVSLLEEVKGDTPIAPLQAWRLARPHRVQQWWAPLSSRMWLVWLWLPWFWVAQPQAAPRSTFPLASCVHPDRSTTTVSHKSTTFMSCLDVASSLKKCRNYIKPVFFFPSTDTLFCSCCSNPGLCLFPGACLPCNRGFYQPLSGQQQCWPCQRGYYTKWV